MSSRVERRFWHFVDKRGEEECWLWTGSISKDKYKRAIFNSTTASRFLAGWMYGGLRKDTRVVMKCGNPLCVNPNHIVVSSPKIATKLPIAPRPKIRTRKLTIEEGFWSKVDKRSEDECWPWLGSISKDKYRRAMFSAGDTTAARYLAELIYGELPKGVVIQQKCGNLSCVNPNHIVVIPREEYFWSFVDKSKECWEWTGLRDRYGYGHFYDGSNNIRAHRYSYLITNGSIKEGAFICHKCNNPPCVRPDHLYEGDAQTNSDDKMRAGRHRTGERTAQCRISDADVVELLLLYRSGTMTRNQLAARYHVDPSYVTLLNQGRYRKDISTRQTSVQ